MLVFGGGNHDLQFMICSSSWPQRPPSPKPTWHRPRILQSTDALHLYRHRITGPWRKRSLQGKSPWRKSRRPCSFLLLHALKTKMTLENHHWFNIQDTSSNSCWFPLSCELSGGVICFFWKGLKELRKNINQRCQLWWRTSGWLFSCHNESHGSLVVCCGCFRNLQLELKSQSVVEYHGIPPCSCGAKP